MYSMSSSEASTSKISISFDFRSTGLRENKQTTSLSESSMISITLFSTERSMLCIHTYNGALWTLEGEVFIKVFSLKIVVVVAVVFYTLS